MNSRRRPPCPRPTPWFANRERSLALLLMPELVREPAYDPRMYTPLTRAEALGILEPFLLRYDDGVYPDWPSGEDRAAAARKLVAELQGAAPKSTITPMQQHVVRSVEWWECAASRGMRWAATINLPPPPSS